MLAPEDWVRWINFLDTVADEVGNRVDDVGSEDVGTAGAEDVASRADDGGLEEEGAAGAVRGLTEGWLEDGRIAGDV